MCASAEGRRLAPRNVAESSIQRQNWQFETHRRPGESDRALAFEHTGKTHVPGQSELPMDSRGRRRRELARKCRVSVETARPNVAITSDTPATASLYSYEKCSSLVPDSSPDAHRA